MGDKWGRGGHPVSEDSQPDSQPADSQPASQPVRQAAHQAEPNPSS